MNFEDRLRWVLNQPERKPKEHPRPCAPMGKLVTQADVDRIKAAKKLSQDRPEQPKESA
jgi:hypothetical protein